MKTLIGNLKKAVIEMLILKLLSEQDMYGYQITQEFKKRSNGHFTLLEGSMYPILYRLKTSGCITSYETKTGVRMTRVYYHLEPSGRNRLQDMIFEYQKYIDIISFLVVSQSGDIYE